MNVIIPPQMFVIPQKRIVEHVPPKFELNSLLSPTEIRFLHGPKFVLVINKVRFFSFPNIFQMSDNFFYEDGQGNIANQQGNEAMDHEEEFDPFNIYSLMIASRYRVY